jgi:hypothetical protein
MTDPESTPPVPSSTDRTIAVGASHGFVLIQLGESMVRVTKTDAKKLAKLLVKAAL